MFCSILYNSYTIRVKSARCVVQYFAINILETYKILGYIFLCIKKCRGEEINATITVQLHICIKKWREKKCHSCGSTGRSGAVGRSGIYQNFDGWSLLEVNSRIWITCFLRISKTFFGEILSLEIDIFLGPLCTILDYW